MTCPVCGRPVPPTARACARCGAPLQTQEPVPAPSTTRPPTEPLLAQRLARPVRPVREPRRAGALPIVVLSLARAGRPGRGRLRAADPRRRPAGAYGGGAAAERVHDADADTHAVRVRLGDPTPSPTAADPATRPGRRSRRAGRAQLAEPRRGLPRGDGAQRLHDDPGRRARRLRAGGRRPARPAPRAGGTPAGRAARGGGAAEQLRRPCSRPAPTPTTRSPPGPAGRAAPAPRTPGTPTWCAASQLSADGARPAKDAFVAAVEPGRGPLRAAGPCRHRALSLPPDDTGRRARTALGPASVRRPGLSGCKLRRGGRSPPAGPSGPG